MGGSGESDAVPGTALRAVRDWAGVRGVHQGSLLVQRPVVCSSTGRELASLAKTIEQYL